MQSNFKSYHIENLQGYTIDKIRQALNDRRLKSISNKSEVIFDANADDVEVLEMVQDVIEASEGRSEVEVKETQSIPLSLKNDFYRMHSSRPGSSNHQSNRDNSGYQSRYGGSRRGEYSGRYNSYNSYTRRNDYSRQEGGNQYSSSFLGQNRR